MGEGPASGLLGLHQACRMGVGGKGGPPAASQTGKLRFKAAWPGHGPQLPTGWELA